MDYYILANFLIYIFRRARLMSHLCFLRDVWIQTLNAAATSGRATNLATGPSDLAIPVSVKSYLSRSTCTSNLFPQKIYRYSVFDKGKYEK
jgi:hypothetical protein